MSLLDQMIDLCEIKEGDIVLVSSDLMSFYHLCKSREPGFDMADILDAFTARLGTSGTLLVPTYHWGFCRGQEYHYLRTRGSAGALGNMALRRNDFKRTRHPIYSFAVWGRDAEELAALDYADSFGKDSVFAYLHHHKASNMMFNVDYNHSFTFLHYVEEAVGCSYRFLKDFTADYIDAYENKERKTYSMYVRNLDLDVHMFLDDNRFEEYLIQYAGAVKKELYGNVIRKIRLDDAYDAIQQDILYNNSKNLCSFIGQD